MNSRIYCSAMTSILVLFVIAVASLPVVFWLWAALWVIFDGGSRRGLGPNSRQTD